MKQTSIVNQTRAYVQERLSGEASGHDWWHIVRVEKMAKGLAEEEGADLFLCQMGALLHDIADEKIAGSEEKGLEEVRSFLTELGLDLEIQKDLVDIITGVSYKGGQAAKKALSLEGKIVQDADRLDAIGAIGIARVMAYSGHHGRVIHNPSVPIREQMTLEEYRSDRGTAITHFYEKLLRLKDKMHTVTAKRLAAHRHAFLETYLEEFYAEWDGKR